MAKKKNKKIKKISKPKEKESSREKMIGQHIGYRYDVNLLPDYKKVTPFLKKYIEHMGWDDLNWLEDVHMEPSIKRSSNLPGSGILIMCVLLFPV